jgi:CubicO group peptidase (beta-lactamase class C family)
MSEETSQTRSNPIRRRGFIGAGLATTAAALLAPVAAGARRADSELATTPPGRDRPSPDVQTLVSIPPSRFPAAVGKLDAIIKNAMRRTGVPGVAAAVVHRDKLLYARGFGVRDLRTGQPVTANTVFQLASVSKPLAATVVAGAVGRKHVSWDELVIRHLPGFALRDPYVTAHVTIADLFSHRSGLPNHAGDLLEDLGYGREYVLDALRLEPLAPFRAQWQYTNFGLTAAAESAARAAGTGWAGLADQVLFGPLAMRNSSFRYSDFARRANRAALHVRIDGRWEQRYQRDADPQAPAGGASSNVLDMARWLRLLLADGRWRGGSLIDTDAFGEMRLPRVMSGHPSTPAARSGFYGYGTNVGYDYSGRLRLGHSGGFAQGTATVYSALPLEQLGIVVLTNGMPIGVPEAIAATFFDLVVAGAPEQDWLAFLEQRFAGMYVNHSSLAGRTRPRPARPARPDAFYVGHYDNDYYGTIQIQSRAGKLHLLIGPHPNDYPLEHWDGNVFGFFPTGENALGITAATFEPDPSGRHATRVTLEFYDENGLGVFEARGSGGS